MQRGKFNHEDKDKKVSADEMLNMIKHGAQEIILSCNQEDDQNMKDHIDQIIEDSLKKTEKLEKELKLIEDKFNLNQVSLTGDDGGYKTNIYQMDGEEISRSKIGQNNNLPMDDWIDIGARRRKEIVYIDKR